MGRYKKMHLIGLMGFLIFSSAVFAFPPDCPFRGEREFPFLPYRQNNPQERNFPVDFPLPPPPEADTLQSPAQSPTNYAEAWQEVERILNAQYTDKNKQIQDLIQALKKWAELYNQERDPEGKLVKTWFPEANSLAQVDLTAMIKNLLQHPFYGNHPLWTERVNLLLKASISAGLWYGEIPEGFEDFQLPAQPTTAPTVEINSEEVKITWESIERAETYELEILGEGGKVVHTLSGIKENSFTIRREDLSKYGMEEGKSYQVRIRGVNQAGKGEFSPLSPPFKIEKTLQPPAKPNPPQTDKPIYKPDDLITISWKEVEEATSYNLYILDEQGNIIKKIENISETRFAQKGNQLGLEEGKRYQVSVSGVNAAGEGPRSEPSSVFSIETTPRPPVRPKKPNTDKSSYRPDEPIKISWEAVEGAVSYNIYIYAQEDGKEIKKLMGIQGQELVKTAQELGLEPGNYYLQISAVNEAGESELSEKSENFSIVPSGVPPSQPPPVSATPTSISIQLSPDGTQATITWQWDGDPNAEFELQIAFKGENIETGEIIKVKGVNFYTFTNLASGSYKVRLRAKEPGKEPSSWTEVVGFTISAPPPVTAPEAPRGLRVEASADNVVISWEEVADANAGYEVEIRDDRDNLVHSHQTAKSSEVTAYKFNPQNVDGQGKKLAPGNYKVRIKAIKEERGERSESPWSNYVDFNIPAPPQPPTQPPPSRQSIQERFQISVRDGTEALLEEIIASEIEDLRFWLEKKYSPEKYEIEISVRPPEVPFTPDAEYIENLYYTLEALPQSLRDKLKGLTIWVYGSPIYFDYTVINKNTGKTVEKDTNALMGKKGELISPQGSYPASPYGVVLFYSEKARQQMKTEGWRNPPPFRAVLFHELSHVLYHTFLTTQQRIEFESYYRNSGTNPQNFVSTYAMTSVREDFAETMAAYFTNSINLIAQAKSSPVLLNKVKFVAGLFKFQEKDKFYTYIYKIREDEGKPLIWRAKVEIGGDGLPIIVSPNWERIG